MDDKSTPSKFDKVTYHLISLTSLAIRFSLIVLFVVVAWRIAWSNFSLDLSKFDFSDLLAMILALFAIAMSIAFYFKSSDSSNLFYDNIYNFTQKTSEILGRIEERFGERLKHLDEGYGRIQSKFDGISKTPDEIEKKVQENEGKEKEEKEKLKEANQSMQQMIEKLVQRAQLQEQEKEKFYREMEELAAEKDQAQKKIHDIEEDRDRLRNQLIMIKEDMLDRSRRALPPSIIKLLENDEIRNLVFGGAPPRVVRQQLRKVLPELPPKYLNELVRIGVLNNDMELTIEGLDVLRSTALKMT